MWSGVIVIAYGTPILLEQMRLEFVRFVKSLNFPTGRRSANASSDMFNSQLSAVNSAQQNTLTQTYQNSKKEQDKNGVPSVLSVPKNRYCSEECVNFDKPTCSAPNWQSLNKVSEIPLKCPGYSYIGAPVEDS